MCKGQKRVLDSLELEFKAVVSYLIWVQKERRKGGREGGKAGRRKKKKVNLGLVGDEEKKRCSLEERDTRRVVTTGWLVPLKVEEDNF